MPPTWKEEGPAYPSLDGQKINIDKSLGSRSGFEHGKRARSAAGQQLVQSKGCDRPAAASLGYLPRSLFTGVNRPRKSVYLVILQSSALDAIRISTAQG
jgi:hypothetical protein